eukprot:403353344
MEQKHFDKNNNENTRLPGWSDILPFFLPSVVFALMIYSEFKYANPFLIIWLAYVLIPILDYLLPVDHKNLSDFQARAFEKDKRFLIPVYLTWLIDFTIYFVVLYQVSTGKIAQTLANFLIYAVSYAQLAAINGAGGHELLHRKEKVHKIFGTLAFSKMLYSHFLIQHIVSHHKKVAKPEDLSTARMNESLYAFYMRTIPNGYVEVWNIEKKRKKDLNGKYESISIKHSFNAPQIVTNLILFKLQRHSDHHAYAYKPYQILDSFPESPMLPYGYSVSLILSYFPFIWQKVQNPVTEAINNDTKISEEVQRDREK